LDDGGTDGRYQSSDENSEEFTNQRILFPDPATVTQHDQSVTGGKWNKTNVFRGSKEANLMTSIPYKFCLEKTRSLFSFHEYHMQCYGSSVGPVERAICEFPSVIGSLKGWVSFYTHHEWG
jgi:hypothetical protein